MARYPHDRYDEIPASLSRVGAHRAPPKKGRRLVAFSWAALSTGVLVLVGLWAVSLIDDSVSFDLPGLSTPVATPGADGDPATSTADPVTDPSTIDPARMISITILNGSGVERQQDVAGDQLAAEGWPVGSVTQASQDDVATSTVYYNNPLDEDVARGVALELGIDELVESTAFIGAPITVVLGADFVSSD
jgi:hypothetical protein